jgi:excisionase family DNA binding protein
MNEKVMTVDEAADYLNVSVKTIRRYIYANKLKATKVGGQWRITETQIKEYLNESTNECCTAVAEDDFCVFMDTDYFTSDDKLQLCTIIDYYVDSTEDINRMTEVLVKVVTEDGIKGGKAQYNYVYDQPLKRARFVLWGSASFIQKATMLLKPFEGERNA